MSDAATTEALSPLIVDAAAGKLPHWAEVSARRREHIARVADLLDSWGAALELSIPDRVRWRAAAWLHDALRDAPPESLRPWVPAALRDLDPVVLHGPAASARLTEDADDAVANAIRYHTLGHPSLDLLGRCLYLADFLEPGRDLKNEWRAQLRERMPAQVGPVLKEVAASRIAHLVATGRPIRSETIAFWNDLVEGPT